jgi:hypothetical protein
MTQDGHFDIGMALWNMEPINNSSTERDCVVEQLLLFPCCIAAGCSPEKKIKIRCLKCIRHVIFSLLSTDGTAHKLCTPKLFTIGWNNQSRKVY